MIYYLQDKDLKTSSVVLRVCGPDANTYLQGQFTQDLRLQNGASTYGLWLDLKGKVVADSQILRRADNDYLIVSFSLEASALRARLESYLIADEVEIEDQSDAWEGILLWGEPVNAPPGAWEWPSRRSAPQARQWLVPKGTAGPALDALAGKVAEATPEAAEQARLQAALPAVPVDIGPRDLPNEGGLDEVAISYTKGCYLGQEVMARLKNLGQVRRRLHLVRGRAALPASGTALFQGERKVGETRSAVASEGGFLAMAMLSLVNLDAAAGLAFAAGGAGDTEILRRV